MVEIQFAYRAVELSIHSTSAAAGTMIRWTNSDFLTILAVRTASCAPGCPHRKIDFGEVGGGIATEMDAPVNLDWRPHIKDVPLRTSDAIGQIAVRLVNRRQRTGVLNSAISATREIEPPEFAVCHHLFIDGNARV
jgi:hypothetical protein